MSKLDKEVNDEWEEYEDLCSDCDDLEEMFEYLMNGGK